MTQIDEDPKGLSIRFPAWEALMAGRSALFLPRDAIRSARAEPGWTSEVLGVRSGLAVSGYRKLGTFTHPSGTRRLVSMKRGVPLLRLQVDRAETGFDEILLSTAEAEGIARVIPDARA
ncbi:hypothetical protein [Rothia halotolerans]|uniref:hypothetical protein n=1 Tax=Rothia halotolerans TaxID=405770 RepID=UPI00101D36B6|nr:hypothetical protein [Rothia halotolerans]